MLSPSCQAALTWLEKNVRQVLETQQESPASEKPIPHHASSSPDNSSNHATSEFRNGSDDNGSSPRVGSETHQQSRRKSPVFSASSPTGSVGYEPLKIPRYSRKAGITNETQRNIRDMFGDGGRGSLTVVKELKAALAAAETSDPTAVPTIDSIDDASVVASLLLFCLRDMPEPLATFRLHDAFVALGEAALRTTAQAAAPTSPSLNPQLDDGDKDSSVLSGGMSTPKKHKTIAELEREDEELLAKTRRKLGLNASSSSEDDGDDEEDGKNSSIKNSSSSPTPVDLAAMEKDSFDRAVAAVPVAELRKLIMRMVIPTKREFERVVALARSLIVDAESPCALFDVADAFAPVLCRPPTGAYYSVRHRLQVPALRVVIAAILVNDCEEAFKSSSPTPSPKRDSTQGEGANPSTTSAELGGRVENRLRASGRSEDSSASGGVASSLSNSHPLNVRGHHRRKTPPRPTLEAINRRRSELEAMEALTTSVVDALVSSTSTSLDWLYEETGEAASYFSSTASNPPAGTPTRPHPEPGSAQGPVSTDSPTAGSTSPIAPAAKALPVGASAVGPWCTMERVLQEKKSLKKRLMQWEADFVQTHQRKPGRADRSQIRTLNGAYFSLKQLIKALESYYATTNAGQEPVPPTPDLLILEKKGLQGVLKLFERDFEAQHGRRVETAADVVGREQEYARYKQLKELTVELAGVGRQTLDV